MGRSNVEEQSLGELVASATGNVQKLVRAELELAKIELKEDAKKAAIGGVLFAVAGLIAGMIVILLSIAFAYALVGLGMWHWAAFALVAALYLLLAAVLILVGWMRIKKIDGAPRTRETLQDGVKMLKRAREH
ncbi:phage holin family protein [Actinocorallia sp. A-T 12471]|uniref:phage holin family protein n=1 Tax=Actinocorallia sp. A-T 12471 TaxID=3089813 RepID=UPI0029D0FF3B|nr:phage holin family protein [Actinocorallia sp. A-T 12471]MDX6742566.1 phage holin family protein [Actinocorallia sp. A-T 12471]